MSGALNGGFPVEEVSFLHAGSGACKDQAAAAGRLAVHSRGDTPQGVRQDFNITVNLPEGKKDPGTYFDATATVVLAESATPARPRRPSS